MFSDYTDFENDKLNGWENPAELKFAGPTGNRFLEYASPSAEPETLLRKSIALKGNTHYFFAARLRLREDEGGRYVNYLVNDTPVPLWPLEPSDWHAYDSRHFVLNDSSQVSLQYHGGKKGLDIDDLLVSEIDLTDFKGEYLNGWVLRDDYRLEFRDNDIEGKMLYIFTYPDIGHSGLFLHKPVTGLKVGGKYKFLMRVGAVNALNPAELQLKIIYPDNTAQPVGVAKIVNQLGKWEDHSGTFTATGAEGRLEIHNATNTSNGNDFTISRLEFYQVIEL